MTGLERGILAVIGEGEDLAGLWVEVRVLKTAYGGEALRMVVAVLRPSEPKEASFVKSERRFAE